MSKFEQTEIPIDILDKDWKDLYYELLNKYEALQWTHKCDCCKYMWHSDLKKSYCGKCGHLCKAYLK